MDAFFGGASGSAVARGRARAGSDAIIRLDLDLVETAFGVKGAHRRHRGRLRLSVPGAGTAPGTHPGHL